MRKYSTIVWQSVIDEANFMNDENPPESYEEENIEDVGLHHFLATLNWNCYGIFIKLSAVREIKLL